MLHTGKKVNLFWLLFTLKNIKEQEGGLLPDWSFSPFSVLQFTIPSSLMTKNNILVRLSHKAHFDVTIMLLKKKKNTLHVFFCKMTK